ncbi:WD40 repeat-containing, partial [Brachionus plicatilis]
SKDKTIKIWDKDTFECLKTINGHNSEVYCLAIMQNGNIVSGSEDNSIKIWDKDTFECLTIINGHNSYVNCLAILQNGNIVSGSCDKPNRNRLFTMKTQSSSSEQESGNYDQDILYAQ